MGDKLIYILNDVQQNYPTVDLDNCWKIFDTANLITM